jgi:Arm DNA-binding domain
MPRRKLTAANIEKLHAPTDRRQIDYFDAAYPGLSLRVSKFGVRTWCYHGRVKGHEHVKRVTLGRLSEEFGLAAARRAADEAKAKMDKGIDVTAEKKRARTEPIRDRFEDVAVDWLKRGRRGNRSHDEVKRMLEREVYPKWRDRSVQSITRHDARDLIDGVERRTNSLARVLYAHLHALFRWCVVRERRSMSIHSLFATQARRSNASVR